MLLQEHEQRFMKDDVGYVHLLQVLFPEEEHVLRENARSFAWLNRVCHKFADNVLDRMVGQIAGVIDKRIIRALHEEPVRSIIPFAIVCGNTQYVDDMLIQRRRRFDAAARLVDEEQANVRVIVIVVFIFDRLERPVHAEQLRHMVA